MYICVGTCGHLYSYVYWTEILHNSSLSFVYIVYTSCPVEIRVLPSSESLGILPDFICWFWWSEHYHLWLCCNIVYTSCPGKIKVLPSSDSLDMVMPGSICWFWWSEHSHVCLCCSKFTNAFLSKATVLKTLRNNVKLPNKR